jgi:hypothetical protein
MLLPGTVVRAQLRNQDGRWKLESFDKTGNCVGEQFLDDRFVVTKLLSLSPPVEFPDKGRYMGLCNRRACLEPDADWYNPNMRAHYCQSCALAMNHGNSRDQYWKMCTKGEGVFAPT